MPFLTYWQLQEVIVLNSASPSRCESKETQDLAGFLSRECSFRSPRTSRSAQDAKEDELTEEEAGGWHLLVFMSTPLKV